MKAIVKNDATWHNRIDESDIDIYNIDKTRMTWTEDRGMEKSVTLEEALKRIEELEKENAELREELEYYRSEERR